MSDLPRFRVVSLSYIGHNLVQPDTEVTIKKHDDKHTVGANLWPINATAQAWVDGQKPEHPAKGQKLKPAKVESDLA